LDTGSHPRGGQLDERRGDEGRRRPRTGSLGEGGAGRILAVPEVISGLAVEDSPEDPAIHLNQDESFTPTRASLQ
jgi:hypothetical protein